MRALRAPSRADETGVFCEAADMLSSVTSLATAVLLSSVSGGARALVMLYQLAIIAWLALSLASLRRCRRLWGRYVTWPCPGALRRKRALWALQRRLAVAASQGEWEAAAAALDVASGAAAWRAAPHGGSAGVDLLLLEETTARLRAARGAADVGRLMFMLRGCVVRRFAGLDDARLHRVALCGTRLAVEAHAAEVEACLDLIAASALPPAAKVAYFEALRRAYGRTALCLSGGGALALAHAGVLRCLLTNGLVPRVISGCSGGAIVAAFAALYGDAECLERYLVPHFKLGVTLLDPLATQLATLATSTLSGAGPRMVDPQRFEAALRALYGDATFSTAFAATGRVVCISVTTGSQGGSPSNLLLSYLTAPDVLLYSAVAASCALPGLMRPVELKALDHEGRTVPYHSGGVTAVDGSMAADIPAEALALLFGVNCVVVSQCNPHVRFFLQEPPGGGGPPPAEAGGGGGGGGVGAALQAAAAAALGALERHLSLDVQGRLMYLRGMGLLPSLFGRSFDMQQRYEGDVTIVPRPPLLDLWRAVQQPDEAAMAAYIAQGERATWGRLAHVRALLAVEKRLSQCARRAAAALQRLQLRAGAPPLPPPLLMQADGQPLLLLPPMPPPLLRAADGGLGAAAAAAAAAVSQLPLQQPLQPPPSLLQLALGRPSPVAAAAGRAAPPPPPPPPPRAGLLASQRVRSYAVPLAAAASEGGDEGLWEDAAEDDGSGGGGGGSVATAASAQPSLGLAVDGGSPSSPPRVAAQRAPTHAHPLLAGLRVPPLSVPPQAAAVAAEAPLEAAAPAPSPLVLVADAAPQGAFSPVHALLLEPPSPSPP